MLCLYFVVAFTTNAMECSEHDSSYALWEISITSLTYKYAANSHLYYACLVTPTLPIRAPLEIHVDVLAGLRQRKMAICGK